MFPWNSSVRQQHLFLRSRSEILSDPHNIKYPLTPEWTQGCEHFGIQKDKTPQGFKENQGPSPLSYFHDWYHSIWYRLVFGVFLCTLWLWIPLHFDLPSQSGWTQVGHKAVKCLSAWRNCPKSFQNRGQVWVHPISILCGILCSQVHSLEIIGRFMDKFMHRQASSARHCAFRGCWIKGRVWKSKLV